MFGAILFSINRSRPRGPVLLNVETADAPSRDMVGKGSSLQAACYNQDGVCVFSGGRMNILKLWSIHLSGDLPMNEG